MTQLLLPRRLTAGAEHKSGDHAVGKDLSERWVFGCLPFWQELNPESDGGGGGGHRQKKRSRRIRCCFAELRETFINM